MKNVAAILLWVFTATLACAQQPADSVKVYKLPAVSISETKQADITRLEPIQNTFIFSGKKNEVITLGTKDVALTEKYGRQVFAKIPGVFVYDMDGTGNQVNISVRGLDPHRGWELNIRKDGILTNTDMYGYPASHYNIPMEAVDRIELVRGTGSLQYGAQFGGMLNYVSKQPDTTKAFSFESINTAGSYGLLSTFNSASGRIGKFKYYAWFNTKKLDGYRDNSRSAYDAENITLIYEPVKNLSLKAEWTRSNYLIQLAGPLTDSMFYADPRSATRSRNYYDPDISIPSLSLNWKIKQHTRVRFTASAVLGSRSSVMFDKPANIADTIVTATLQYNNRQVDIDTYHSYTAELRVLHAYKLLKQTSTLVAGVQYMNNNLHRRQLGKGTTGSDYDLTLVTPGWGRNLYYKTGNIALFAENRWVLFKNFSLNTGMRMEIGETNMTGTTTYYQASALPNTIKHSFPLFGANAEYAIGQTAFYAGFSQAYRPVIFKDIVPASIYEVSDKNLKDAYGYNLEAGFRGTWKILKWDVSAFRMQYNNRLGTLAQTDSAGNLIIFRTNIGNSLTQGIELFLQSDVYVGNKFNFSVFTSTSYMDAHYVDATIRSGNDNISINNNKVESVPNWISRNGATLQYSAVSLSILYSYVSESFADAANSATASASGATGLVPSYQLLDINTTIRINQFVKLKLNLNNVLDEHYFTKRPQFYPGPGIWASDGRSFSATVSLKI